MTPRDFRQEKDLEFDHFQELTSTGIKPNYVNIELFAQEYHQAKLKLLGIGGVVGRSEQLKAFREWWNNDNEGVCTTITHKDIERYLKSL